MPLSKHAAPGANAAFTFQFERALYWLASSPAGFVIGIETDDDVSVRGTDGSLVMEQDKHSIRDDSSPFGDRSRGLWNTLAIWLQALEDGEVSIDNTRFLMVTNRRVRECIAQKIHAAESPEESLACIEALVAAADNPPDTVGLFMKRVLRSDSRNHLASLLTKCQLADASSASSGPELRAHTLAELQLPKWCLPDSESLLDELRGWLIRTVMDFWRQEASAWIQRDNFVNMFHAILGGRKRRIRRERAENLIPVSDNKVGTERARPFVKQVQLVTQDDGIVDNAIRDFIRCNIEKMRLSAEGNVTDDDWVAFETTLQSRWQRIRARVQRMSQTRAEEDIGFEVFTDTTEDYREKLAGTDTEQVYLTSGTYHRLADLIRLGWHPRFEEIMREMRNSDD